MLRMQHLSPSERDIWVGFLRTHDQLVRELDQELRREHDLPLSSYDVLVQLESAPGGAMRMSDLAQSVLLSRSGLTRLVDRLEREQLLERRQCPEDARGSYAAITASGRARLEEARSTHLAGVRRLFLDRLEEPERERLAATWDRLS
ncbi:MAG: MarR family transcriptional regulator [Actinomycetota bacterium]|nr:MarR family transcriptional regulator [Actinomycetota bacterium]